ncbi:MAG: MoxR family ATPase [Crenarchaeota archaeon]|nr:MoxR family ATPase [Thermoproteota archaeon]MCR8500861.1 MoxR family ATPase [Thermoproteota archaeon]
MNHEELRDKILLALKILEKERLFVHTKYLEIDSPNGVFRAPLIAGLAVLNAIVGNGAMLLWGGYGYGKTALIKYLGRLLTGMSLEEVEASILRANPQLIEEKIVGRLHLGKLVKEGEEEVIWRRFIRSFWKIIDEINRLSPGAQDVVLSLLGEGLVKYFDAVFASRKFVLYATLNPRDVGTFPLSMPLLDRFGIAVVVKSPLLDDMNEIVLLPDDRVLRKDVPAVLSINELVDAWAYVEAMPLEPAAQMFISILSKEISLCDRVDKETGIFVEMGSKICVGCQFENLDTVCKYVYTPLSVRAQRDLARYAKALAWLMGLKTVPLSVVVTIAPYVIWHRLRFSDKHLEEFGFDRFRFAKHIVESVLRNFLQRLPIIQAYENLKAGKVDPRMIKTIKNVREDDIVVKFELEPFIDYFLEDKYINTVNELKSSIELREKARINEILEKAKGKLNPIQYSALVRFYTSQLRENGKKVLTEFKTWKQNIAQLSQILGRDISSTLNPPASIRIDKGSEIFEIIVVDDRDNAPVILKAFTLWHDTLDAIVDALGGQCEVS